MTYEDDQIRLVISSGWHKGFRGRGGSKARNNGSEFGQFEGRSENGARDEVGDWELDDDDDFEEEQDADNLEQDSTDATLKKNGAEEHSSSLNDPGDNAEPKIPTNVLVLPLYAMLPQRQPT